MTRGDFILAILPPAGAILVELMDLLNIRYLRADATRILGEEAWAKENIPDADREVIRDIVAISAAGASEIAGLAPTFVSVITSGFGILKEIQIWLWPTVIYVTVIMVMTLGVIKLLRGSTCYAVAGRQLILVERGKICKGRVFREGIRLTRKQISAYIIYTTNAILIVLASAVFILSPGSENLPATGH